MKGVPFLSGVGPRGGASPHEILFGLPTGLLRMCLELDELKWSFGNRRNCVTVVYCNVLVKSLLAGFLQMYVVLLPLAVQPRKTSKALQE